MLERRITFSNIRLSCRLLRLITFFGVFYTDISTQDEVNHENHGQQFAVANKGGLGTTRFGKGFQRKNERDISNPVKDVLIQIAADTETRKECLRQSRSEFLKVVDAYNGYDPISCKPRTNGKMQTSFIVFVGFETSMYRNITSP
jgi:hypothetical protein